MGSCGPDTLCAYCDEEEAGYIPDGCVGPMCGSCMDLWFAGGHPEQRRLQRRALYFRVLCSGRANPNQQLSTAAVVLLDERIACVVARWLIWL